MYYFGNIMEVSMGSDAEIHVELDVGNLCVLNAVQLKSSINSNEDVLKSIAAQGALQLINKVLQLPTEFHEHVAVAKLPEPITLVPREKPIPKKKPQTRWEKYSRKKGIQKTKKEKLVWDKESKDWKPQYGYRSANNKTDWLIEVPDNADPNVDYYAQKQEGKKERIAKNEYQRLRNIADTRKMKVTNLESVDKADKHQLSRSIAAAKTATASLGRFMDKLPKEKPPKNNMKKRLFKSNFSSDMKEEKENSLKILQELSSKKPKLDVPEAVERQLYKTRKPVRKQRNRTNEEKFEKKKMSKSNKKVKKHTKSSSAGGKRSGFKKKAK